MAASSTATTVWEGGLADGSGVTTPQSGAFPGTEVSWASRTKRAAGKTSPEELLAAAHASCYSMALSHELGEAGTPPDRLETIATVEFVPGDGVTSSHIVVSGRVPGVDAEAFAAAAQSAGENCPISAALRGNVAITVDATLDG
jgi:osmotically inducible protein OsmC